MKNLRPLFLGLIIGALATYFFCPRQESSTEVNLETSLQAKTITKPKGVITVDQAKNLNDNFTKFRKHALDSITQRRVKKNDYRWAWWSLEDIEDYIAFIKNETEGKENFTGLRVYLGVYGTEIDANKEGLTTMFIVPTGSKVVNKGSVFSAPLQGGNDNLPQPPLNNGTGGGSEYP